MTERSRIRFNPVTSEIEVEGTEEFVKTYFAKLQAMISGAPDKGVSIKKESKPTTAAPVGAEKKEPKAAKTSPRKKVKKATKKEPGEKRVTNIDMIIGIIQGSAEGVSTAQLKEKAGLAERQIWNVVTRAAKEGKIRKIKRGLYVAR